MAKITRDHGTDEIVIRIPRGKGAGGFARFLELGAEALEHGKLAGPVKAAGELRKMAMNILKENS